MVCPWTSTFDMLSNLLNVTDMLYRGSDVLVPVSKYNFGSARFPPAVPKVTFPLPKFTYWLYVYVAPELSVNVSLGNRSGKFVVVRVLLRPAFMIWSPR